MKGYKVFNSDWTCRGFQYAVGETFRHEGEIKVCDKGFHFCRKIADCFSYYNFDSTNKVAEIEAVGKVITNGNKSVTDEIRIVREISWHEVLDMVNIGVKCTGFKNTGDYNSGYFNSCCFSSGFFNSVTPPVYVFNKPLSISRNAFIECQGVQVLLRNFNVIKWVHIGTISDAEKAKHPEYDCVGGYLKTLDYKTAFRDVWAKLSAEEKQSVREIPNFDPAVFEEITSIDVMEEVADNAEN